MIKPLDFFSVYSNSYVTKVSLKYCIRLAKSKVLSSNFIDLLETLGLNVAKLLLVLIAFWVISSLKELYIS